MIQIDDAGSGLLIGGMLVGVLRTETDEFTYGIVEPAYFQGAACNEKAYLIEARRQAEVCFERLKVQPEEEILCCTGNVLDGVCEWLKESDRRFMRGKITGALQDYVERALQNYLADLGFEVDYELLTLTEKKGLLWKKQVEWLKGSLQATAPLPSRSEMSKSGWRSYQLWAHHSYQESQRLRYRRRRVQTNRNASQAS